MSEAELHVLKARLRGGILNKVRRGEYRCVLPTGFVYDEAAADDGAFFVIDGLGVTGLPEPRYNG